MKYRHYGLEEFHTDCRTIAQQLVSAEYYPDYWIALDRGGVIATATIRREFQNLIGNKRIDHFYVKHKDEAWDTLPCFKDIYPSRILLVDDIVDFGLQYEKSVKEFDLIKPKLGKMMPRTKHAALIWNLSNKCGIRADFYGQTIDKENNPADNAWIKFWWER